VDPKAYIEFLKRMLEIYSPSGREDELASFLMNKLESFGFERVRTDRAGNIYGEVGNGSPTVLLCGHMDTVPGRIPVKIEGDRLWGRGAVDAKSSLAAMISAATSLELEKGKGSIIAAGVVEEERTSRGIRQLLRERFNVNCAIFGEPSGVKNITFAYRGKLGFKITLRTPSGHVGAQHLIVNPIEEAFKLWSNLKASCKSRTSPHGVFYSMTPCLVDIRSRRVSGVTPEACTLEVDMRLPPTIKSREGLRLVEEVVDKYQDETQGVSVTLRAMDRVDPFVASRETVLMGALKEAVLEVTGGPVRFLRKTGTGDMNIFGVKTGVPVATYGPGDSRLSHTSKEYIELAEYLTSIEVYRRTLGKLLSSDSKI